MVIRIMGITPSLRKIQLATTNGTMLSLKWNFQNPTAQQIKEGWGVGWGGLASTDRARPPPPLPFGMFYCPQYSGISMGPRTADRSPPTAADLASVKHQLHPSNCQTPSTCPMTGGFWFCP